MWFLIVTDVKVLFYLSIKWHAWQKSNLLPFKGLLVAFCFQYVTVCLVLYELVWKFGAQLWHAAADILTDTFIICINITKHQNIFFSNHHCFHSPPFFACSCGGRAVCLSCGYRRLNASPPLCFFLSKTQEHAHGKKSREPSYSSWHTFAASPTNLCHGDCFDRRTFTTH